MGASSTSVVFYRSLLVLKFLGVLGYAGGFVAAFVASNPADRRRAVHRIASPALLVVWLAGYLLTAQLLVPLTELWIVASLVLSFASLLALIHAVTRARRDLASFAAAALPVVAVVILMAFRPTWSR